jgi:hypothetical protein
MLFGAQSLKVPALERMSLVKFKRLVFLPAEHLSGHTLSNFIVVIIINGVIQSLAIIAYRI